MQEHQYWDNESGNNLVLTNASKMACTLEHGVDYITAGGKGDIAMVRRLRVQQLAQ
jgi:hypothetical protein